MSNFIPRHYSLREQDLIPPTDDAPEHDEDVSHARACRTLDTESLMQLVAERFGDHDALRALVEATKRAPFTSHDRRTVRVYDAIAIGDAIADLLAEAMDELVEQRLAGLEVR